MRTSNPSEIDIDSVIHAGVAHDIVNAVQLVTVYCELALKDAGPAVGASKHAAAMRRSAELASSLCVRLMRSAISPARAHVNVNDSINRSIKELSPQADAARISFSPENPTVFIDSAQLAQGIRNILLNAIQASGGVSEGISIESSHERLAGGQTGRGEEAPSMPDGDYSRIDIHDAGHGMSPKTLSMIFDPGFTTKTSGSGIGLSAAIAIMRRHAGTILARSVEGRGSTFTILLPLSRPDEPRPL